MLLDEYHTNSEQIDSLNKGAKKLNNNTATHLFTITLYALIIILIFSSIFYSQKIVKEIENKKNNIQKLEQTYQSIANENDKISILLTEIQNKETRHRKILKINEDTYFKNEAEKIIQQYNQKYNFILNTKTVFWIFLGILALAVMRFIFLEFANKKIYKYARFKKIFK